MQNAAIDVNSRQTITVCLKTDGVSIVRLTANPTTGGLDTTSNTSGAVVPLSWQATDDNDRTSWAAVSEYDPNQIVRLQCDSTGALLVKYI